MTPDESLTHVMRLLSLLRGAELAWAQKSPNFIRLGLMIREPRSLAILAHIAVAANIPLNVEVAWDCPGGHDDPACVRYDLRVPLEDGPFEAPSNLQMVGGMLARKLKRDGILAANEADQLLRAWNFMAE
jgi:hypothetical protein